MPRSEAEILRDELREDEGYKLELYRCPTGHLSIGIGRNLEANGIRPDEAELMLTNDIAEAEAGLDRTDPGWREHPMPVRLALRNLMFNMGEATWRKFVNTRKALRERRYADAANGLRASKWFTQVQESRRSRIVAQVEKGATWSQDDDHG